MSAERPDPPRPVRRRDHAAPQAPRSRLPASTFPLAIYLAAFTVPGLGSTLAWAGAYASTRDSSLTRHYRRALTIQLACVVAMVAVQASVVGALWFAAARGGSSELRPVILLAGVHLTAGIYLAMGLIGPILLLAEPSGASTRNGRSG